MWVDHLFIRDGFRVCHRGCGPCGKRPLPQVRGHVPCRRTVDGERLAGGRAAHGRWSRTGVVPALHGRSRAVPQSLRSCPVVVHSLSTARGEPARPISVVLTHGSVHLGLMYGSVLSTGLSPHCARRDVRFEGVYRPSMFRHCVSIAYPYLCCSQLIRSPRSVVLSRCGYLSTLYAHAAGQCLIIGCSVGPEASNGRCGRRARRPGPRGPSGVLRSRTVDNRGPEVGRPGDAG